MQHKTLRSTSPRLHLMICTLILAFTMQTGFIPVLGAATANNNPIPADQRQTLLAIQDSFSAIVQRVVPGMVSITSVYDSDEADISAEFGSFDDLFRRFLEKEKAESQDGGLSQRTADKERVTASGSGTIIGRDGNKFHILTNYHVVSTAYNVSVRLSDDTNLKGVVVGVDPVTDLAVVQVLSNRLSDRNIVPLGDSDEVKVGTWALAIGSPYGFEHTLTIGVVSALQRQLQEDDTMYPNLIQTDAAMNKGNSGGPLLNIQGQVIGVNTAIASPTGGSIGIGFAIPINNATEILDQLIRDGRVVRGWLGIGIQELTPELAEYYGVPKGVVVAAVSENSPAALGRLQPEDVIIRLAGTPTTDALQLQHLVAGLAPGTRIAAVVVRAGQEQTLSIRVGESPSTPKSRPSPPVQSDPQGPGFEVRNLNADVAKRIGLPTSSGVIVTDIDPGEPPADAGLEIGDIVLTVNRKVVATYRELTDVLKQIQPGGIIVLKVMHEGSTKLLAYRAE